MRQAGYILMIISTVLTSILIIPLAWTIPMTLHAKKIVGDGQDHIAFGICQILFTAWPFGLLAGIFTLIEK